MKDIVYKIKSLILSNWRILTVVILVLLIGVLFSLYQGKESNNIEYSNSQSIFFDLNHWQDRINSVGGALAYEEFKEFNYGTIDSTNTRHAVAHEFGALLYQMEGLDALSVCDDAFFFGCHHAFLGEAISDHGVEAIHIMDEACNESFTDSACQHGIGHGLVSYYGYDRDDLDKALEQCGTLTDKGPAAGCGGGVFMEYNFRTMANPDGSIELMREFDPDDPHEPCQEIDERFRGHCYYEQPNVWKHVFDWDYTTMGTLCLEAPTEELADICLGSLGYSTLINNEYDRNATMENCSQMPDVETHQKCVATAAKGYADETEATLWESLAFCDDLPEPNKQMCRDDINEAAQRHGWFN